MKIKKTIVTVIVILILLIIYIACLNFVDKRLNNNNEKIQNKNVNENNKYYIFLLKNDLEKYSVLKIDDLEKYEINLNSDDMNLDNNAVFNQIELNEYEKNKYYFLNYKEKLNVLKKDELITLNEVINNKIYDFSNKGYITQEIYFNDISNEFEKNEYINILNNFNVSFDMNLIIYTNINDSNILLTSDANLINITNEKAIIAIKPEIKNNILNNYDYYFISQNDLNYSNNMEANIE